MIVNFDLNYLKYVKLIKIVFTYVYLLNVKRKISKYRNDLHNVKNHVTLIDCLVYCSCVIINGCINILLSSPILIKNFYEKQNNYLCNSASI